MSKKPVRNEFPPENTKPKYFCASDAPWGGFINVKMTDDLKQRFYEWLQENAKHVVPSMMDMMSEGMKFTQSYDHENQCFIVTVTAALLTPYPDRYCVTSRAGTLSDAVALAVWKHYILIQGNYGAYQPRTNGFGDFG